MKSIRYRRGGREHIAPQREDWSDSKAVRLHLLDLLDEAIVQTSGWGDLMVFRRPDGSHFQVTIIGRAEEA